MIQLTQEPNEKSWPYVQAYSGANQILIGQTLGRMMLQARDAAKQAGMQFKSPGGKLLVFQHPAGEKTGTERFVRLSYANSMAHLNEAMTRLAEVLVARV